MPADGRWDLTQHLKGYTGYVVTEHERNMITGQYYS